MIIFGMKKMIFLSIFIFLISAAFADSMVVETGGTGMGYEHNQTAGFYAGAGIDAAYRFEYEIDTLPIIFLTGAGLRTSFNFDLSSSQNPASKIWPVYMIIEEGVKLGSDVEILLRSGAGFTAYFDTSSATVFAPGITAGGRVRNFITEKFFVYYDVSWSTVFPYGTIHKNRALRAGAGWKI